ncbi:hypothetical protein G2W53_007446 [Senna tora]|uniref:Uncharacterized protein n=1 Tax=Senna tora TaxID=362788 RepID=A0A835CE88_9FABA|nr:hypothetical protein G2W53_007446 [Senna tora]
MCLPINLSPEPFFCEFSIPSNVDHCSSLSPLSPFRSDSFTTPWLLSPPIACIALARGFPIFSRPPLSPCLRPPPRPLPDYLFLPSSSSQSSLVLVARSSHIPCSDWFGSNITLAPSTRTHRWLDLTSVVALVDHFPWKTLSNIFPQPKCSGLLEKWYEGAIDVRGKHSVHGSKKVASDEDDGERSGRGGPQYGHQSRLDLLATWMVVELVHRRVHTHPTEQPLHGVTHAASTPAEHHHRTLRRQPHHHSLHYPLSAAAATPNDVVVVVVVPAAAA